MKVALCLYGQPRNFSQNWEIIRDNVVFPNEADVFFHTWYDEDNLSFNKMTPGHENRIAEGGLISTLPQRTGAKKFVIEKQISFSEKEVYCSEENFQACWPWADVYDRKSFLRDRVFSHYSMWYSISKSLLSKEIYSQEQGFTYDCVIISRFDVSPKKKVDVSTLDVSKIVSGVNPLPRGEISDWFIISNNKNSNIIGSIFYSLDHHRDNIINSGGIWTNEAYLREQIKVYGIETSYIDFDVTF